MFQDNIKYLGFNDFWFMVIGIISLGFLIPLIFFNISIFQSSPPYYMEWMEACIYAGMYWMVNRALVIKLRKRYPLFEQNRKRIFLVVILSLCFCGMAGALCSPLIVEFFLFINPNTIKPTIGQGISATITSSMFFIAVYESIWYYSQLKKSIQEQERVKSAHIQSQLDGLRNQVNPHFLFNSLNTLNHIVEFEDKKVAKQFINQLSKVYRYILDSREDSTIELQEEIEFVKAYIAIQKERFLDNLHINIDIPKDYSHKKIIPLSLQLLVENAIKHNVISTKKPLTITISVDTEKDSINVVNNLQKKSKVLYSTKVGLENIRDRYRLLDDARPVKIEEQAHQFIVQLPLI